MLMLCACNKPQPVEDTQAPDENVQEQAMDKAKGDSTKNENKLKNRKRTVNELILFFPLVFGFNSTAVISPVERASKLIVSSC